MVLYPPKLRCRSCAADIPADLGPLTEVMILQHREHCSGKLYEFQATPLKCSECELDKEIINAGGRPLCDDCWKKLYPETK